MLWPIGDATNGQKPLRMGMADDHLDSDIPRLHEQTSAFGISAMKNFREPD
jgi:hypothetical protein